MKFNTFSPSKKPKTLKIVIIKLLLSLNSMKTFSSLLYVYVYDFHWANEKKYEKTHIEFLFSSRTRESPKRVLLSDFVTALARKLPRKSFYRNFVCCCLFITQKIVAKKSLKRKRSLIFVTSFKVVYFCLIQTRKSLHSTQKRNKIRRQRRFWNTVDILVSSLWHSHCAKLR